MNIHRFSQSLWHKQRPMFKIHLLAYEIPWKIANWCTKKRKLKSLALTEKVFDTSLWHHQNKCSSSRHSSSVSIFIYFAISYLFLTIGTIIFLDAHAIEQALVTLCSFVSISHFFQPVAKNRERSRRGTETLFKIESMTYQQMLK